MTHGETVALSIAVVSLCIALVTAYIIIGRKRWSLVREGWCERISYHDWVQFAGVCPYTYDDLYRDETDTDFHFKEGKYTVGCTVVKHDVALPSRIRLEANWLGSYRVVAVDAIEKAA